MVILYFYYCVNYILIVADHLNEITEIKIILGNEFDMKDLCVVKKIFGMDIDKDMSARKLWLSQKIYFENVLDIFTSFHWVRVQT